jgi:hypothetical protein
MAELSSIPSFGADVKPLFRDSDREAMLSVFDLWDYDHVKLNSSTILERLDDGTMPCDGDWPVDQVSLFEAWIAGGMQP